MEHGILEPWKIEWLDQARAVVAEALRVIKGQSQKIAELEAKVAQLSKDSRTSSKRPCEDTPALVQQVVELSEKPITRPRQNRPR